MTAPVDEKRGWRRVLRRESEWSAVEWIGLAVVVGLCFYAFDHTHQHHEGIGGAMVTGALTVVGILIGRRIRRRRDARLHSE